VASIALHCFNCGRNVATLSKLVKPFG
jgi:hypothetical protein